MLWNIFLAIVLLCSQNTISERDSSILRPTNNYYSIQIKAVPEPQKQQAFDIYETLREQGYLVYYYKVQKEPRNWWIRIRLGLFSSKADADAFGKWFRKEHGYDYYVVKATVFVDDYKDKFQIVTTPSAIWKRTDCSAEEIYRFESDKFNRHFIPEHTQALVSPDGEEIVFYYDFQIIKVDLDTQEATILGKDKLDYLLNSSPRWSPSGKYIAFFDIRDFEALSNLWIVNRDGTNLRRWVDPPDADYAVKSFLWHPTRDSLYFVEGYGHGTVHVGGDLVMTDLQGNRQTKVEKNLDEQQEVASNFHIKGDSLYYKIAHFKDNYMAIDYTEHSFAID